LGPEACEKQTMPEAATARVLALEVPEAHCSQRIARLYDPPASILLAAQDFAREASAPATPPGALLILPCIVAVKGA
jgi:hypothetical protein